MLMLLSLILCSLRMVAKWRLFVRDVDVDVVVVVVCNADTDVVVVVVVACVVVFKFELVFVADETPASSFMGEKEKKTWLTDLKERA